MVKWAKMRIIACAGVLGEVNIYLKFKQKVCEGMTPNAS
jgi:hypothetical protein